MNEPVSRDEILAVLKKHVIATIDGATEETIASAKTLGDIGASSLDIVEIVSSTMRELKIKVPRAELMLVESLDELVDLLHQRALAGPATPPPPAQ
jgi:acyl carrier protein